MESDNKHRFVDTSKGAANRAILNTLQNSGESGTELRELVDILGFDEENQLLPRLRELQGLSKVEQLSGKRWRIFSKTEDLPEKVEVHGPESSKFVGYKNSLQTYAQRKHIGVPQYYTKKANLGYFCSVSVGHQVFRSKVALSTTKEAEQRAAFDALQELNLIDETAKFDSTMRRKRANSSSLETTPSKFPNLDSKGNHKSMLNELAQKMKLATPTYRTWNDGNGFMASVTFNSQEYTSKFAVTKKKEAEQAAAYMALFMGGFVNEPQPENSRLNADILSLMEDNGQGVEDHVNKTKLPSATLQINQNVPGMDHSDAHNRATSSSGDASFSKFQTLDSKGNHKSMLNELAQKMKLVTPTYKTWNDGNGFMASVTFNSQEYTNKFAVTKKKEAEQAAAYIALFMGGFVSESRVENSTLKTDSLSLVEGQAKEDVVILDGKLCDQVS